MPYQQPSYASKPQKAEATAEDQQQNKALASDAQRLAALEQEVKDLRDSRDAITRQLSGHAGKLKLLEPLKDLVEFVETIKAHFANLRLR